VPEKKPPDLPKMYAVLTGDVIRSRQLSVAELEGVRGAMDAAVDDVKRWRRGIVRGRVDFFRGDAWQLLLCEPAMALRVAIFLRARLRARGQDTRVAIGLGTVEKVSSRRTSLSLGEAFVRSGHALDAMPRGREMAIAVPEPLAPAARWLAVVVQLVEAVIEQWTPRQAEVVALALQPERPTHEEIAEAVRPAVDRPVVSKTLGRADCTAVQAAIECFEQEPWQLA
jgi:hypothetical protein